jgi:hypothetical protein
MNEPQGKSQKKDEAIQADALPGNPITPTEREWMALDVVHNARHNTGMSPAVQAYWLEVAKDFLVKVRQTNKEHSADRERTDRLFSGVNQLEEKIKLDNKLSTEQIAAAAPEAENALQGFIRMQENSGRVAEKISLDDTLDLMLDAVKAAHKARGVVSEHNPSGAKDEITLPPPDGPGQNFLERSGESFLTPNTPTGSKPRGPSLA